MSFYPSRQKNFVQLLPSDSIPKTNTINFLVMPCACIADNPKYPQNEEWGPILWRILHTLAEKGGLQTDKLFQADEERTWPLLVKTLGPAIPCPYCRDDFNQWLATHPFILPEVQSQRNHYIRQWFYDFHESVNSRLQKPSFPFDQLSATYSSTKNLQADIANLETLMIKAMKLGGVTISSWQTWQKHMRNLRAFL